METKKDNSPLEGKKVTKLVFFLHELLSPKSTILKETEFPVTPKHSVTEEKKGIG